jgi:hypothetical protein
VSDLNWLEYLKKRKAAQTTKPTLFPASPLSRGRWSSVRNDPDYQDGPADITLIRTRRI